MESYRLKNVVLLILLLLNLFLLLLVGSRTLTQRNAENALIAQTVSLLQTNQIEIDDSLLSGNDTPVPMSCQRNAAAEISFAQSFLGAVTAQNEGGGVHLYSSDAGAARFRSNGYFDFTFYTQTLLYAADLKSFLRACCPEDMEIADISYSGSNPTVTMMQTINGTPIYNCTATFVFEDQYLVSASGRYLSGNSANSESQSQITRAEAAVRLLQYCSEQGNVCNEITAFSVGYSLQSTASDPLFLVPVYQITTDTRTYYVNFSDGQVTPA